MIVTLTPTETKLRNALEHAGMNHSCATLAIVMVTRAHARPEEELVEIVRQYPGLEDPNEVRRAIRTLRSDDWLSVSESYGRDLTHQTPDLRRKIADKISDLSVEAQLLQIRASVEQYVKLVGPMKDMIVYDSFLRLLAAAQQRICLPMLATTPYDDTVRILKERAANGVHIQILLGAPSLVARLRGETMRQIAVERIKRWHSIFRHHQNVTIRVSSNVADMSLSTCVGIDNNIARLDVYDHYSQRSLEGVMIEVTSPQGMSLNLVDIFHRAFDSAWARSYSVERLGRVSRFLRRQWRLVMSLSLIGIVFLPVQAKNLTEVLVGVATGLLVPVLIEDIPRIAEFVKKLRSHG